MQETLHAAHLLKLLDNMYKYEMDPTRTVGATERTRDVGWTDWRTDGQTDGQSETYIPSNNFVVQGYKNKIIWWRSMTRYQPKRWDIKWCFFFLKTLLSNKKKIIGPDQALKGLYQVPPKQLPGLSQRHWLFKPGCFGGNYWSDLSLTEDSGCHVSSQVYDMKMALSDKFLLNIITLMSQMLTKVVLPIKNMRPSNRTIYP